MSHSSSVQETHSRRCPAQRTPGHSARPQSHLLVLLTLVSLIIASQGPPAQAEGPLSVYPLSPVPYDRAVPAQAAGPLYTPAGPRHYRAGETPPGLTAADWRQLVTQLEQDTYDPAAAEQPGHFQAFNPVQDWRLNFASGPRLSLVLNDAGANYPLAIDPLAQQAYLKASNTGADDQFGYSVAVDGDTVVVGAYNSATLAGAAYTFP